MLESVQSAPPDPILGLSEAFKNDIRPEKINLTIGVYKDEHGNTPVLSSVKKAEERLLGNESTKGYLGIDGLGEFNRLAVNLTLGKIAASDRVAAFQSPGGTGALRIACDFIAKNFRDARIWHSQPTWPNHPAIFAAAGLEAVTYPYLGSDKKTLDFAAMLHTLEEQSRAGDVVCLHACCHNPTGIDPTPEQWKEIAEVTSRKGLLPLVDFAYHGFAKGLEEDRAGLEALAERHDELIVCSSYSKNFGLYSERIGAMLMLCPSESAAQNVTSNVKQTVRSNYSNPPRHGGAIVATVLADEELTELWKTELDEMRSRIHSMRQLFVESMVQLGCEMDFSFLLDQNGMFSFSNLTPMQVDWLRTEKGIYIVGSGRINIAGMTPENASVLTKAIAEAVSVGVAS